MTETQLLKVHLQKPLAARWFPVAAYILSMGYELTQYDSDGAAGVYSNKAGREIACVYIGASGDGKYYWSFSWTANEGEPDDGDGGGEAEVEDEGWSDTWYVAVTEVLATMQGIWHP